MTEREEKYAVFISAIIGGGVFVDCEHPACGTILIIVGSAGLILSYLSTSHREDDPEDQN